MNTQRGGPSPVDLSADTARRQLEATDREVGALRAELDRRLAALEAALARPGSRSQLEDLVIGLARVATTEAQSAATRAALAARVEVQELAAATIRDLQTTAETERASADAIRHALAQSQAALEEARTALARAQRDRDLEREAITAVRARLQDVEATQANTSGDVDRRVRELEALGEHQREQLASLEAALAEEHNAAAQERETAARLWDTVSTLRRELAAARQAADAAHQSASDATARLADLTSDRDALSAALEQAKRDLADAREAASAATATSDVERQRLESERAALVERLEAAERRASQSSVERDDFAGRIELFDAQLAETQAKLDAAEQARAAAQSSFEEQIARLDAERTQIADALKASEARADAAAAERDREPAPVDAPRDAAKTDARTDAKTTRLLKAAVERIRMLEFQLAERHGAPGGEIDLEAAAAASAPVLVQAGQHAQRFAFRPSAKILIDREEAQLVDLSLTGAQFIARTSPEVGRVVLVTLPSDAAPCFGQGRLLWARREPAPAGRPQRYRVGLMFTEVDQSAVDAFIKHHAKAEVE